MLLNRSFLSGCQGREAWTQKTVYDLAERKCNSERNWLRRNNAKKRSRTEVDHRKNSSDTRYNLIFTRNRSANAAQRRGSSENKYPGKELVQRTVNRKEMQFRPKIIPARDPNSVVGIKG